MCAINNFIVKCYTWILLDDGLHISYESIYTSAIYIQVTQLPICIFSALFQIPNQSWPHKAASSKEKKLDQAPERLPEKLVNLPQPDPKPEVVGSQDNSLMG